MWLRELTQSQRPAAEPKANQEAEADFVITQTALVDEVFDEPK
jgi:hypothetical protein